MERTTSGYLFPYVPLRVKGAASVTECHTGLDSAEINENGRATQGKWTTCFAASACAKRLLHLIAAAEGVIAGETTQDGIIKQWHDDA